MNTIEIADKVKFKDKDFVKSTFSNCAPNHCVMIAKKSGVVAVRDSKDKERTTLFFSEDEWKAFVCGVKAGEF